MEKLLGERCRIGGFQRETAITAAEPHSAMLSLNVAVRESRQMKVP
jgi:hypothetical protein